MLSKIIFLIKSKAHFKIIYFFIYQKIKNIFIKNKVKSEKVFTNKIFKSLNLTSNFFSKNAFLFYFSIKKLDKLVRSISYLEIGSFEGCSAFYVYKKFKPKIIYCIDIWKNTNEGYNESNFNLIEKNFNKNTRTINSIKKIKITSDSFFKKNKVLFDVIYIDGYHHASQVYKDCINSWKFLKKNGILIFDDYIWDYYENFEDNPCFAVNSFLKKVESKYKIIMITNSQLSIQKI
jgi:predicted O-methyltransferase YrrM